MMSVYNLYKTLVKQHTRTSRTGKLSHVGQHQREMQIKAEENTRLLTVNTYGYRETKLMMQAFADRRRAATGKNLRLREKVVRRGDDSWLEWSIGDIVIKDEGAKLHLPEDIIDDWNMAAYGINKDMVVPVKEHQEMSREEFDIFSAGKVREYGGKNQWLNSGEYRKLYPYLKAKYDKSRVEYANEGQQIVKKEGLVPGDAVEYVARSIWGMDMPVSGVLYFDKKSVPKVRLDGPGNFPGSKKFVTWHRGWRKINKSLVKQHTRTSKTGNRGTFDPDNPDITKALHLTIGRPCR